LHTLTQTANNTDDFNHHQSSDDELQIQVEGNPKDEFCKALECLVGECTIPETSFVSTHGLS
jgi:hypothetical protein